MAMEHHGGIDLDEKLDLQRRQWRLEGFSIGLLCLMLVAALLGILGNGPMANASAGNNTGTFTVEYQRFVRHQGESDLILTLDGSLATNGHLTFWIASDALALLGNPTISPQPDTVTVEGDRVVYTIPVAQPSSTVTFIIEYSPEHLGLATLELGATESDSVSFRQLAYP